MTVEAIGDNGYGLTVGKFKSLNHEVEPKIGLHLLPQEEGVYRIETIPVPGYEPTGYDVDFKAYMTLCEGATEDIPADLGIEKGNSCGVGTDPFHLGGSSPVHPGLTR